MINPVTPMPVAHRAWPYPLAMGLAAAIAAPPAHAATSCSFADITALGVPGVTIVSATAVAATAASPPYCDVVGQLNTANEGAPEGSAGFELQFPAAWNKKFLFFGVGGLGGSTYGDFSANYVDLESALAKGYATAITDTGHLGNVTDGSFALVAPGQPDEAKLADYYARATHEVTLAAKALTAKFYGGTVVVSYFDGCSNGGRQALVQATQFPGDYNGIIAGDPFFDIRSIINGVRLAKQELTPETYIPATLLPVVDAAVNASCDAADGVTDGLIQNPGACHFNPYDLVCKAGQAAGTCLTAGQAETLNAYFTPTRDAFGGLVYPGFSVSNLATSATGPFTGGGADVWTTGLVPPTSFTAREPWGNAGFSPAPFGYQFADHVTQDIVERDPNFNTRDFAVTADGTIGLNALQQFDAATAAGDATNPASYARFFTAFHKLIIYHGFSDPALTPFRTINLYQQLASQAGGYKQLARSARLFTVPGMQHCIGGPGPNTFDTLSALERWVEHGVAPDSILAAHYVNDDLTQPVDRTMPLCSYPTEATYDGAGPINAAQSWSCKPNDRLLDIGPNGVQAGENSP